MLGVGLDGIRSVDVVHEALDRDVWVYPAGCGAPVPDAVLLAPPFVVDEQRIDRIVEGPRGLDRRRGALRSGPA